MPKPRESEHEIISGQHSVRNLEAGSTKNGQSAPVHIFPRSISVVNSNRQDGKVNTSKSRQGPAGVVGDNNHKGNKEAGNEAKDFGSLFAVGEALKNSSKPTVMNLTNLVIHVKVHVVTNKEEQGANNKLYGRAKGNWVDEDIIAYPVENESQYRKVYYFLVLDGFLGDPKGHYEQNERVYQYRHFL